MTSNVAPERALGSIAQGGRPRPGGPRRHRTGRGDRACGTRVASAAGKHPGSVTVAERAAARRRRPRTAHLLRRALTRDELTTSVGRASSERGAASRP
jgi:hypothetical protein